MQEQSVVYAGKSHFYEIQYQIMLKLFFNVSAVHLSLPSHNLTPHTPIVRATDGVVTYSTIITASKPLMNTVL